MKKSKSAFNKSVLKKLRNFSNSILKNSIFTMTELQLISKLSEMEQQPSPTTISSIRIKAPKRILHFSDGTLEEYSSDDEVDGPSNQNEQNDGVKFEFQCHSLFVAYPQSIKTYRTYASTDV